MAIKQYTDVNVVINGSGIMADSASVSTRNDLQEVYILGRKGIVGQVPKGPLQSSFSVDYYLKTSHDHALNTISVLRTGHNTINYPPDMISIGGITGASYLSKFSISVDPTLPVKAKCDYICFDQPSGTLSSKLTDNISYNISNISGIAHGYTSYVTSSTNYVTGRVYNFDYSCDINWVPVYILGNKFPVQVQFQSAKESFSLTSDVYTGIQFSGQPLSGNLNLADATVDLYGLGFIKGVNNYLTQISLSGAIVKENETSVQLDDFVRIKTNAENFF